MPQNHWDKKKGLCPAEFPPSGRIYCLLPWQLGNINASASSLPHMKRPFIGSFSQHAVVRNCFRSLLPLHTKIVVNKLETFLIWWNLNFLLIFATIAWKEHAYSLSTGEKTDSERLCCLLQRVGRARTQAKTSDSPRPGFFWQH